MNQTDRLKEQLLTLQKKLHKDGYPHITFKQQKKTTRHMSFVGGNGRLLVQPFHESYDIALSGRDLTKDMTHVLVKICKGDCHGYKQTNRSLGKMDTPFWRVKDFSLVEKAALHYAKTKK